MSNPTERTAAEEFREAQTGAAAVDLSAWTVLRLRGPDTRAFLQGLATQDFEGASDTAALPTLFLNEKGRPVSLAWVSIESAGGSAWVLADEGAPGSLRSHLERFHVMEDVEFEGPEATPRLIGVLGPERATFLHQLSASMSGAMSIAADPISFLLGGDRASDHAETLIGPATLEAWRLNVGIPRAGVDFDLDRIATELSLSHAISMTKGCYVGQEVVSRTSNRGQVRRRRVGFRFDWNGAAIPARTEIRVDGVAAGYVTSTAQAPEAKLGLGMGYLSTDAPKDGADVVGAQEGGSTRLYVQDWPLLG